MSDLILSTATLSVGVLSGFKVVSAAGEKLESTSAPRRIKYSPKEWTKPPEGCGPLTLFSRLEDAETFVAATNWETFNLRRRVGRLGELQIWECRYDPEEHESSVWCSMHRSMVETVASVLPLGTVLARRIRLVKLIRAYDVQALCGMVARAAISEELD